MTPTNGKKPLIRPEPIKKDGHLKKYDDDNWIFKEAIKNLKSDITIVKNFKDYLEKEHYESLTNYLESFFEKELKDKKEKLRKVSERLKKVESEVGVNEKRY